MQATIKRKVDSVGRIKYEGQRFKVGKDKAGKTVKLAEMSNGVFLIGAKGKLTKLISSVAIPAISEPITLPLANIKYASKTNTVTRRKIASISRASAKSEDIFFNGDDPTGHKAVIKELLSALAWILRFTIKSFTVWADYLDEVKTGQRMLNEAEARHESK